MVLVLVVDRLHLGDEHLLNVPLAIVLQATNGQHLLLGDGVQVVESTEKARVGA